MGQSAGQRENTSMRYLCIIALLLAFIGSGCSSSRNSTNHQGNWVLIGERKVDFRIDRDIIPVNRVNDNFTKLKLKVTGAALQIADMRIHYENGATQDVALRYEIPQGGETRTIDLTGGSRSINRIEFWYSTKGVRHGKARVIVFGRR